MNDQEYESVVGIIAGIASGIVFGLAIYLATSVLLLVSPNLVLVVLEGAAVGALTGLCAGLMYSRAQDSLPVRSSIGKALFIALVFALPWGLIWFITLPMTVNVGSNIYMMFIHKLGIETPWLYIPISSQQVTDLEGFSVISAYVTAYFLVVLAWVVFFGLLLGYLWEKRTSLTMSTSLGHQRAKG